MAGSDQLVVWCPHCKRPLSGAADLSGKVVTCPGCGRQFRVPLRASLDREGSEAGNPGYKFVDLAATEILPAALELVPESVARGEQILPLTFDGEMLTVLVSEPPSPDALERLRFVLNRPVSVAMAPKDAILSAIERYYGSADSGPAAPPADSEDQEIDFVEVVVGEPEARGRRAMIDPDHPAVVRMVQRIIGEALQWTASRVLVLPVKGRLKVGHQMGDAFYFREDAPLQMHYPVLVRLMTMTNLSGLIKVHVGEKERELHVVFKPTRYGLAALIEITPDPSAADPWRTKAARLGYTLVDLDQQKVPAQVLELVPEPIVRKHRVLPVSLEGDVLTLVMSDPPVPDVLDQLRFLLNRPISIAIAPPGTILAAIDRYYGPADPEAAELISEELAGVPKTPDPPARPKPAKRPKPSPAAGRAGAALFDHLRSVYRDEMFDLFEQVRSGPQLCQQDAVSGDLEVVFPQSHLMSLLPPEARRYIEDKIWALREAVIARLEGFLADDPLVRGVAMTYAEYLAGCRLREGRRASLNPAGMRDAWINFMHALAIRCFPSIQSNGALLGFVTQERDQFSTKIAELIEDPSLVRDPKLSREWIARFAAQTTTDEAVDCDSPPTVRLVDLLLAEAVHARASRIVILPQQERIEVAYRVQKSAFAREGLPLGLLYPVLARLAVLAEPSGEFGMDADTKPRRFRPAFRSTQHGLAALVEILPDTEAVETSRALAEKHGIEFVQLDRIDVPQGLLRLVPQAVVWHKVVLPLSLHEGRLRVALSAPPSSRKLDELRLAFNCPISVAIAPEDEIRAAIYRHYHSASHQPAISPAALSMLRQGRGPK